MATNMVFDIERLHVQSLGLWNRLTQHTIQVEDYVQPFGPGIWH